MGEKMEEFPQPSNLALEEAGEWHRTIQLYESYEGRTWNPQRWAHVDGKQVFDYLPTDRTLNTETFFSAKDLLAARPLDLVPDCSIIVPCALVKEGVDNISDTVDSIYRACRLGSITAEVTLWIDVEVPVGTSGEGPGLNPNNPTSDALGVNSDAYLSSRELYEGKIKKLVEQSNIASLSNEFIRVRSVFAPRPPGEDMNDVRHKSMVDIAKDALRRGIPDTLIVGWIDADTRGIAHKTLGRLCHALEDREAHVAHAEHVFGQNTEKHLLLPLERQTDVRKASVAYSITKRMLERNLSPNEHRPYNEECGFFTRLREFLRSGGNCTINPEDGKPKDGEAKSTIKRMGEAMQNGIIEPDIDLIRYYPEARVIVSDRWVRTLIELLPDLTELPRSLFGPEYKLYSDIMDGSTPRRKTPITSDEVREMMLETERFHKEHTRSKNRPEGAGLTDKQRDVYLDVLLGKLAFAA